ncbi:MAG: imidazoleglycerol-phosphate dehydratase HisB [Oscillibacter sp.]|jgi:imidazoleglycerol-phosphate dehydratase|nr:imidazoleglycerol-phosphate dehydratase HisB [Oscillibacter sp.]
MRTAEIKRDTNETKIYLTLNLDGTGKTEIDSGCGFLNHMLTLFAHHGDFDLTVKCNGDTDVDYHHSVEDIGICLGSAFAKALGDKRGITRYGQFLLPMDETLVLCAVDLSGRDYLGWSVELPSATVGDFDTELAKEFWLAFVRQCPSSIHIRELAGENTHHILEAVFKGMGHTLKEAVSVDAKHAGEIPSTKGTL